MHIKDDQVVRHDEIKQVHERLAHTNLTTEWQFKDNIYSTIFLRSEWLSEV